MRGDNQPLYVIDNIPQASTGEFSSSGISGDFQIAQDPVMDEAAPGLEEAVLTTRPATFPSNRLSMETAFAASFASGLIILMAIFQFPYLIQSLY